MTRWREHFQGILCVGDSQENRHNAYEGNDGHQFAQRVN